MRGKLDARDGVSFPPGQVPNLMMSGILRRLYTACFYLLLPLVLIRLIWRGIGDRSYWRGWEQRFGLSSIAKGSADTIWVHAVSVGEVRAAAPLVKAMRTTFPDNEILITTMTPTGAECARLLFGSEVSHSYVPYDLPAIVRRFLGQARPKLAIFMETELWPNVLHECRLHRIPVVVANARLSERSFNGYKRISSLMRDMLNSVTSISAQSKSDAERFISLGMEPANVIVSGNLKFDLDIPADIKTQGSLLRDRLGTTRPIWIAVSSHQGEEPILLEAHRKVLARFARCLLLIAPRHPQRFGGVDQLVRQNGFRVANWTAVELVEPDIQVMVINTMGELLVFCAAADIAFVGGSLVETGGHNMLEPAAVETPVLTGPHVFNFREVSERLHRMGAAYTVENASELADEVCRLLDNPKQRSEIGTRALRVVRDNQGAVREVISLVRPYIEAPR